MARSTARAVRGASGMVTTLPPPRVMTMVRCPFQARGLDIGADGLGDAEPVESEQEDQRVLAGWAEPGGDQQSAEFVAVQAGGGDS